MVYINDRNVLCQIREAAIVPVVVLDDAKDAVPLPHGRPSAVGSRDGRFQLLE